MIRVGRDGNPLQVGVGRIRSHSTRQPNKTREYSVILLSPEFGNYISEPLPLEKIVETYDVTKEDLENLEPDQSIYAFLRKLNQVRT